MKAHPRPRRPPGATAAILRGGAYQFAAEHPGEFTWDHLEPGPAVWKVRIGRR